MKKLIAVGVIVLFLVVIVFPSTVTTEVKQSNACMSNNPPYEPSNPNPKNGSSDVPLNAILSWTGGDPDQEDIVTYDVYFDISYPPIQRGWNQSETFWIPHPKLYAQQCFLWKIVAWDNHGESTKGPIWWFTTRVWVPPPGIFGPHSGNPGVEYDYEFVLCSPYGSVVSFYIKWGDGNITDWTEFSIEPYSESHTWSEEGVYTIISAKAKELDGYETGWSYFEVTMPKNYNVLFLQWFERFPLLYKLIQFVGW